MTQFLRQDFLTKQLPALVVQLQWRSDHVDLGTFLVEVFSYFSHCDAMIGRSSVQVYCSIISDLRLEPTNYIVQIEFSSIRQSYIRFLPYLKTLFRFCSLHACSSKDHNFFTHPIFFTRLKIAITVSATIQFIVTVTIRKCYCLGTETHYAL